jgi:hypothetical protein
MIMKQHDNAKICNILHDPRIIIILEIVNLNPFIYT